MIITGHRGAAALAAENSMAALLAGQKAGVDMLEFDIRLTADGVPVLMHDRTTLRTHGKSISIARTTAAEIRKKIKSTPIPTLAEVLDVFFGKTKLNIELKSRGSGTVAVKLVAKYIRQPSDWKNVMFSSFHPTELAAVRKFSEHAELGMLHRHNPLAFVTYHRKLKLTAVGFYKLTVNPLAVAIAKKRGIFTYAYTVNHKSTARILQSEGIEGIVTDHPERFKD